MYKYSGNKFICNACMDFSRVFASCLQYIAEYDLRDIINSLGNKPNDH